MPSAKQNRIKRQKQYAQNKEAANLYMMEYREKKKDIIQLSNKEYYKSKMKISMKEGNKNEKKKNYANMKDAKKLYFQEYYKENKDDKRQCYEENIDAKRQYYVENKDAKGNTM